MTIQMDVHNELLPPNCAVATKVWWLLLFCRWLLGVCLEVCLLPPGGKGGCRGSLGEQCWSGLVCRRRWSCQVGKVFVDAV